MTIYFQNDELIDLNVIRLMGVSVKTGNNPIGYFGTGLKFAIATILRTGGSIELIRDNKRIKFHTKPADVRGQSFDIIYMNDEPLSITTETGKNWKPWQAFRELYSNTLDEGGVITDQKPTFGGSDTLFIVDHPEMDEIYRNREQIFIQGNPVYSDDSIQFYPSGDVNRVYYRGVFAHETAKPCMYRYNILAPLALTEDRTLASGHSFMVALTQCVALLKDKEMIEQFCTSDDSLFEAGLDFDYAYNVSQEFYEVCKAHRNNMNFNSSAFKHWIRHAKPEETMDAVELDEDERRTWGKAVPLLRYLKCPLELSDINVVESLGENVHGAYRNGKIFIARQVFDQGSRYLASTVYEEYLHKAHHYRDESRPLQNFLFERLLTMTERLVERGHVAPEEPSVDKAPVVSIFRDPPEEIIF